MSHSVASNGTSNVGMGFTFSQGEIRNLGLFFRVMKNAIIFIEKAFGCIFQKLYCRSQACFENACSRACFEACFSLSSVPGMFLFSFFSNFSMCFFFEICQASFESECKARCLPPKECYSFLTFFCTYLRERN